MLPLLLKALPIGKLIKFLFLFIVITGGILAGGMLLSDTATAAPVNPTDGSQIEEEEEEEADRWDSILYQYENGLQVHYVQYDGEQGIAEVYMSLDDDNSTPESAVITDATWESTGEINRVTVNNLTPGQQQIYTIRLANPGNEAITIDSGGDLWAHVGESSDLRTAEETEYPIVVGGIAGTIILILLVSLQQFSGRYRNKAKNPIGNGGVL